MITLAIANQKGGVGKTSTTLNLAAALTREGRQVLVVDLDPQASLTQYFLNPGELTRTVYQMLLYTQPIETVAVRAGLALLPATIDLAAAEIQLPSKMNQARLLARMLKHYEADYCLIDCPPSLGVLTTNALTAASLVLIPVATELMAERTIPLILSTIEQVRDSELNPTLRVWRILPTLYDQRLAHHKEILQAIGAKYGNLVYPEPMKARAKYKDAVTAHADIAALDQELGAYWDRVATALIAELATEAEAESERRAA